MSNIYLLHLYIRIASIINHGGDLLGHHGSHVPGPICHAALHTGEELALHHSHVDYGRWPGGVGTALSSGSDN